MLAKRCPATTKRSMSLRLRKRPGPVQLAVHVGFAPSTAHRVLTRYAVFARIEVLLELLGPGWYQELGTDYGNAAMHLLARYADPQRPDPAGPTRLARFLIRYSHGQWREEAEGRRIVNEHHQVAPKIRAMNASTRKSKRLKHRTSRVSQESLSAPTSRLVTHQPSPTGRHVA